MQEVAHDGAMRDFGVVRVGIVDGMVFAFAHVRRERLAVVRLLRVVGRAVAFHEISEPGIRARRIIWRIGQGEDVLILADGKTLDLAELGVFQFLREQF